MAPISAVEQTAFSDGLTTQRIPQVMQQQPVQARSICTKNPSEAGQGRVFRCGRRGVSKRHLYRRVNCYCEHQSPLIYSRWSHFVGQFGSAVKVYSVV